MYKNRVIGLDIVRCIAIIFVLSVHFFAYTSFYSTPLVGKKMIILLFFRWLFYCCVPLFLVLTGYLKNKKKLSKKYYSTIKKIIYSYLFISICIYFFKKYFMDYDVNVFRQIFNILGFESGDYSWYVEMYIGLFLLIPFLNIVYNNLKNKKQKKCLIITMILLTAMPPLLSHLSLGINTYPDYWVSIYPISYYFIGCYINEYKIKISKKVLLFGIVVLLFCETILTYFYSYNSVLDKSFLESYGSIFTMAITILIFLLLYDIKLSNMALKKTVYTISKNSFDIYLFSYITDNVLYKYFKLNILNEYYKMPAFVFMGILITLVFSLIKNLIFKIISFINQLIKKSNLNNYGG